MAAKTILSLPSLKLRGSIILAAAAVFTLAIGASLFYVVTSNRQKDLQQADEVVNQLAITESQKINAFLAAYAAAASSTARTAEALIGEPNASPSVYGAVVTNQLKVLPEALGVYMMFSPDAKLANSPVFGGSKFKYASGHVGVYATRAADGKLGFQSLESRTASMLGSMARWLPASPRSAAPTTIAACFTPHSPTSSTTPPASQLA